MEPLTETDPVVKEPERCGSCSEFSGDAACRRCGRVYVNGPTPVAPGAGDVWVPSAQVPRVWSVVVTVAVAVGVIAVVGLPMALDHTNPPGDAVVEALEAAGSGDAAAVRDWFAVGSAVDDLTGKPRGHVPPSDISLGSVVKDDRDSATVTVTYSVGNEPLTETVAVARDGLFAPWRIDARPPALSIDMAWPVPVRVAGVREKPGPVVVAPGAYRVAVDHDLFTTATTTAVVGLDGGVVALDPRLSKKAVGIADDSVKDVVDVCADSKEPLTVQSGCPFFETRPRVPEPTSVTWTVTAYPDIGLKPDDGELLVDTASPGEAVVTSTYDKRKPKSYECGFNVDGSLAITGDGLEWSGSPVENLEGCQVRS